MSKLSITLPLTASQLVIFRDSHRFKVVCCGRQFGKSHLAGVTVITIGLSKRNGKIWVISPTYRQSGYLFDKIELMCKENKIPIKVKKSNQEMIITFLTSGTSFQALSGDDPDKLRGQTLDYLIIDESAMLSDEIWSKHLRPMTAVCQSPVLFISTPKGKNWFYELYKLGNTDNKYWKSFHYTSYEGIICEKNHEDGKQELDKIKEETDEITWKQEYLAEFIEEGGLVFTHWGYHEITRMPEDGHSYICGLDLAKHVDYTVLTIYDMDTHIPVDYLRMSNLDWSEQIFKIKEYTKRYHNPRIYCDSTGVGDSIVERLRLEEHLDAIGITFSSKQKQQLIQNLAVMLSREELLIPTDPIFADELERYEYEQTANGNFKYSAPSGYHDDCVCSLALVAWGIQHLAKDIGGYQEPDTVNDPYRLEDMDWDLEPFEWEEPTTAYI